MVHTSFFKNRHPCSAFALSHKEFFVFLTKSWLIGFERQRSCFQSTSTEVIEALIETLMAILYPSKPLLSYLLLFLPQQNRCSVILLRTNARANVDDIFSYYEPLSVVE